MSTDPHSQHGRRMSDGTDRSDADNARAADDRLTRTGITGDAPIFAFSREGVRKLDQAAIEEFGLPGAVLMENAARHLADEVERLLEELTPQGLGDNPVLILAGRGNNGGDGLAVARHLANSRIGCTVVLTYDPDDPDLRQSAEASMNLRVTRRMGIPCVTLNRDDPISTLDSLAPATLIVDALLGTGISSPPRPPIDALIRWINAQQNTAVLSVDLPTGLDADSGQPLGEDAVRADVTVTLAGLKSGFLELEAQPYVGEIVIGDIGAPLVLSERFGEEMTFEPAERPGDDEAE